MPNGLVRYSWQPAVAVSLRFIWRFCDDAGHRPGRRSAPARRWSGRLPEGYRLRRTPSGHRESLPGQLSGASTLTGQPRMAMAINGSPPMA